MAQQDVATLRAAYEAFNRQDVPSVLAAFDAQIEWIEPVGERSPHGIFRGPQQVAEGVFAPIDAHFAEFHVDVQDMFDAGDRIVATGQIRGKAKNGRSVAMPFAHIWSMRGGKATG